MLDPAWTTRRVLAFWTPLALSWAMMAIGGPIVAAGISRLPDASLHLAAFGLTQDIAVLIESPIIMLLSASVALIRDRDSYAVLRRFMLLFSGGLTLLFALVAFTPLYDVVTRQLIGVPAGVAARSRPAMALLLPWVPSIAWRRFFQGPLISAGAPRLLTFGTAFRVASLALVVWWGVRHPLLPGASLGALALSVSVVVEALVITVWALPVVRRLPRARGELLTLRQVTAFYLPLAATDVMRVLSRPVTAAGLARAVRPVVSLATWPVANGFVSLVASGVMAFQEMVVLMALAPSGARRAVRFVVAVGAIVTAAVAVAAFSPLLPLYLRVLICLPDALVPSAITGVRILTAYPLLLALRNLLRGVLIADHRTAVVQRAMAANFASLIMLLAAGVAAGLAGIVAATVALSLAQLVEDLALAQALRRSAAS